MARSSTLIIVRTYLFSDTTIGYLSLEANYKSFTENTSGHFSKRTVGETSSRISELEKIREFLTGIRLTLF